MNPNDMHTIFREHEQRVHRAMQRYALQGKLDALPATPAHRQWIARAGDALVSIGSRLQAADRRRQVRPQLDTLRNA